MSSQETSRQPVPRPVIFGEVLFDTFPDGQAVLGGAPFNVAWHLQGFGLAPVMVSAIGEDAPGKRVIDLMKTWDMDTDMIQVLPEYPTGRVMVSVKNGQPDYDIIDDQAYDHIGAMAIDKLKAIENTGLLYHGSLIERGTESRKTLHGLRDTSGLPVFMDVNLRSPWWKTVQVHAAMGNARWIKLNGDELADLTQQDTSDRDKAIEVGRRLCRRYGLELLVITRGEAGAICLNEDDAADAAPVPVDKLVDTVGAGDAFSAVAIIGLLYQWPLQTLLQRALRFASAICGIRGATTTDRELYRRQIRDWH